MVFADGVGIGENNTVKNPFIFKGFSLFDKFFGKTPHSENQFVERNGSFIFPIDANLGVEGLPQSGTGQTAIFTGLNASKYIGKHFGPFPYSTTIPFIERENIFLQLKEAGKSVQFANAYPKPFFDYLRSGKKRLNVTALCALNAGMKLNNAKDVHAGKALTAEITNFRWISKLKYKLPEISPNTAAKRLLRLAAKNDFTLFEFYLTDHLGHWRLKELFDEIYSIFDYFLLSLFVEKPEDVTILLCSDHGNIEDISVKTHTRNPALGVSSGPYAIKFADEIKDLTNIKKSIINTM